MLFMRLSLRRVLSLKVQSSRSILRRIAGLVLVFLRQPGCLLIPPLVVDPPQLPASVGFLGSMNAEQCLRLRVLSPCPPMSGQAIHQLQNLIPRYLNQLHKHPHVQQQSLSYPTSDPCQTVFQSWVRRYPQGRQLALVKAFEGRLAARRNVVGENSLKVQSFLKLEPMSKPRNICPLPEEVVVVLSPQVNRAEHVLGGLPWLVKGKTLEMREKDVASRMLGYGWYSETDYSTFARLSDRGSVSSKLER